VPYETITAVPNSDTRRNGFTSLHCDNFLLIVVGHFSGFSTELESLPSFELKCVHNYDNQCPPLMMMMMMMMIILFLPTPNNHNN
jgi:hypothetical protein